MVSHGFRCLRLLIPGSGTVQAAVLVSIPRSLGLFARLSPSANLRPPAWGKPSAAAGVALVQLSRRAVRDRPVWD